MQVEKQFKEQAKRNPVINNLFTLYLHKINKLLTIKCKKFSGFFGGAKTKKPLPGGEAAFNSFEFVISIVA
jgi:hypothetical protein